MDVYRLFQALRDQGNAAYREGKLDEALAAYSAALRAARQQNEVDMVTPLAALFQGAVGAVHNNRAQVYLSLNKPWDARKDLAWALYHVPKNVKAWLRKAVALSDPDVSMTVAAVAACQVAARLDPASAQIAAQLAKLKAAAVQDAPALVALCASHIENGARWQRFEQMVASWGLQWHAVPLHVSISFGSGFSQAEVQQLLAGLGERYLDLHLLLSHSPLTQGQHYQRLTDLLVPRLDSAHTWLLFTDDDDLWHELRTAAFYQPIRMSLHSADPVLTVCGTAYVDAAEAHSVRTPWCVSTLVRAGQATVSNLIFHKHAAGEAQRHKYFGEHWCLSVRLCTLAKFFSACEPAVGSHRFWDLALVKFLRCGGCYTTYFPDPNHTQAEPTFWLYYYRRDPTVLPLTAPAQLSPSAPEAHLALLTTNLALYCSQHTAFSEHEFSEQLRTKAIKGGDAAQMATLARALACVGQQLLCGPNSIYCKLLHSPVCTPSNHVF